MTDDVEVLVSPQGGRNFRVEVGGPHTMTDHMVEVPEDLAAELGDDETAEVELVRASFAFLLEREPPTAILRRFSLEVIGRYFPEYPTEIRRRMQGALLTSAHS